METAQTGTKLSGVQHAYIEWCATGLVFPIGYDEPKAIETVTEFGIFTKTARRTLYNWEKDIPNFWGKVEEIRAEGLSRKLGEYYKWAEISARPVTRKVDGKLELVRAGSAEHLKILLGQSGRKRPERSEVAQTLTIDTVDALS